MKLSNGILQVNWVEFMIEIYASNGAVYLWFILPINQVFNYIFFPLSSFKNSLAVVTKRDIREGQKIYSTTVYISFLLL